MCVSFLYSSQETRFETQLNYLPAVLTSTRCGPKGRPSARQDSPTALLSCAASLLSQRALITEPTKHQAHLQPKSPTRPPQAPAHR